MTLVIVWFYILALIHDRRLRHVFLPYLKRKFIDTTLIDHFCNLSEKFTFVKCNNMKFSENRLYIQCQALTEC